MIKLRGISKVLTFVLAFSIFLFVALPAWAGSIDLPRTGQTNVYAAGDDGAIRAGVAWPEPRFTDNLDQTVTDNLTGLVWTKDDGTPTVGSCTGGVKTWQGALDYVACLNGANYLGYSDWRLPNINELKSVTDMSTFNPALPAGNPFTNVQSYLYWSSTTGASSPSSAWFVDFSNGAVYYGYDSKSYDFIYVRCVRGGQCGFFGPSLICLPRTGQTISYYPGDDGALQTGVAWPEPRFTDNLDQTVNDNLTGLEWTKDAGTPTVGSCTGGHMTWQAALDYVTCLNTNTYLGHNDWRLPNVNELKTLTDMSTYGPSLPTGNPFTNVQLDYYYWSSTTSAGHPYGAWGVGFFYGGVSGDGDKYGDMYVRCVRGGQSGSFETLTITKSGTGVGNVTADAGTITWNGNTGLASYPVGQVVNLTAAANSEFIFTGWSGSCAVTGRTTCQTIMNTAQSVGATFVGFSEQGGVALNTLTISNSITVGGLLETASISVSGGDYSLNGGAFTSSAGTINNGDTVRVRQSSSGSYSTTTTETLSIGGTNVVFHITTMTANEYAVDLLRTGQTTSYAAGDDGDIQAGVTWPNPRFTDNGDQSITDNLTGLIWTKDTGTPTVTGTPACTGGAKTWQGAMDYVGCLNSANYLGHGDWRLPNVNELKSVTDMSTDSPILPAGNPFTNVQWDYYWSSTTSAYYTYYAWCIGMDSGNVLNCNKSDSTYVWPVRGGQCGTFDPSLIYLPRTGQTISYYPGDDGALQTGVAWPEPRFTDNLDQTVTDNLTGLEWTKDAGTPTVGSCTGGPMTWQAALDYVICLNTNTYLGHNDWRLPNVNELKSMMDMSTYDPSLSAGNPFTTVLSGYYYWYWSSTTYADSTVSAWTVNMWHGLVLPNSKPNNVYVWPVRGGQVGLDNLALSVSKTGTGSGSVTSDPAGISCGATCSAQFSAGTQVTLTATLASGSTFTGWTGEGCTGTGTCTVTMDAVRSVTATFTASADTTPAAFTFTDQTGVALSTVVISNSIIVSGINASTTISITGGTYSINNSGTFTSASGTVNNGDIVQIKQTSSGSYATPTIATLTIGGVSGIFSVTTMAAPIAHPSASFNSAMKSGTHGLGVDFTSTSKDASGNACTGNTCSYAWTFGDSSNNTSTLANPTHTYATNGTKSITLTVTDTSLGTTSSVTKTVNITFANTPPVAGVSVVSVDNSWNVGIANNSTDADGDPLTLVSINWGDNTTNTSLTHTYATAGTKTITLTVNDGYATSSASTTVTLSQYTISGNAGESGVTVTLSGSGTATTTTASDGSYSFLLNPGTYTLTPSKSVSGVAKAFSPASITRTIGPSSTTGNNFAAVTPRLTVTKQLAGASTTSGSVTSAPTGISCGSSCSSLYNSGQTIVLTSTAPTGKLTSWTGCDAGSGGANLSATVTTCSVTMGSTDKGVTVNYTTPAAPTLTVTKTANYGSVVGASLTCGNAATTCSATEVLNGAYTITATPATGHSLDTAVPANNWGPGCNSYPAYNKCALTMDASKTIQVNFR